MGSEFTVSWVITAVLLTAATAAVFWARFPPILPKAPTAEEHAGGRRRRGGPAVSVFLVLLPTTFLGMLSVQAYKSLQSGEPFGLRSVALVAILSPLVLRATLGSRNEVSFMPWYRVALQGYQSGFFWQTVIGHALLQI